MGCEQYSPLVSRFLDDDLDKEELDGFLEHLFACASCRQELKAFEALHEGFRKADLLDAPPEPCRPFTLEDLGPYAHAGAGAVPLARPALGVDAHPAPAPTPAPGRGGRRPPPRESGWAGSLSRFIFPQNFLRYAVPMIAVLIVGLWIYPEDTPDRVDVRSLPSSSHAAFQPSRKDAGKENMNVYVMQHAASQPWVHYGNHVPMIQLASAGYVP